MRGDTGTWHGKGRCPTCGAGDGDEEQLSSHEAGVAEVLRMTADDATHDADCEHFREAAMLAARVMQAEDEVDRLTKGIREIAQARIDYVRDGHGFAHYLVDDRGGFIGAAGPLLKRAAAALLDSDGDSDQTSEQRHGTDAMGVVGGSGTNLFEDLLWTSDGDSEPEVRP